MQKTLDSGYRLRLFRNDDLDIDILALGISNYPGFYFRRSGNIEDVIRNPVAFYLNAHTNEVITAPRNNPC